MSESNSGLESDAGEWPRSLPETPGGLEFFRISRDSFYISYIDFKSKYSQLLFIIELPCCENRTPDHNLMLKDGCGAFRRLPEA